MLLPATPYYDDVNDEVHNEWVNSKNDGSDDVDDDRDDGSCGDSADGVKADVDDGHYCCYWDSDVDYSDHNEHRCLCPFGRPVCPIFLWRPVTQLHKADQGLGQFVFLVRNLSQA